MKSLPAHCPTCNIVFEAHGVIGGNATVVMKGSKTRCPKCRSWADLADGTFQLGPDIVKLIEGSKWTQQQVKMIERAYRDLADQKRVTPGAIDALEKVSPELGALATEVTKKYGFGYVAVIILFLIFQPLNINIDLDLNKIIDDYFSDNSVQGNKPKK